ncbi:response regulator transcription factor [Streptomyces sp. NPDC004539]|uniref:helix-turn-helix transcriptional regulator n=1 Tax=Streptomyces sp. NPDC004539 TaxID=3154280 RepID=UPI0033A36AF1
MHYRCGGLLVRTEFVGRGVAEQAGSLLRRHGVGSGRGAVVMVTDNMGTARRFARAAVLITHACVTDSELGELGRAGVAGLVLRPTLGTDLLSAVVTVGGGGRWVSPAVGARLLRRLPLTSPAFPTTLTGRERQVLEHIAVGASNAEIAEGLGITVRTVKHHVTNLLGKLGARDRAHAVAMAHGGGG